MARWRQSTWPVIGAAAGWTGGMLQLSDQCRSCHSHVLTVLKPRTAARTAAGDSATAHCARPPKVRVRTSCLPKVTHCCPEHSGVPSGGSLKILVCSLLPCPCKGALACSPEEWKLPGRGKAVRRPPPAAPAAAAARRLCLSLRSSRHGAVGSVRRPWRRRGLRACTPLHRRGRPALAHAGRGAAAPGGGCGRRACIAQQRGPSWQAGAARRAGRRGH